MGVIVSTYEGLWLFPSADQWVISVESKALHVCAGVNKPVASFAVGCWTQVYMSDGFDSIKVEEAGTVITPPTPVRNRDKTRRMDVNAGSTVTRPVTR